MADIYVFEGYVYEYCHADDCHTVLLPRKVSEEEIRKIAEEKLSWLSEESKRKEIEEYIIPDFKNLILNWRVFWLTALEKEATIPCEVLTKFKGKKVRITIEVVENEH